MPDDGLVLADIDPATVRRSVGLYTVVGTDDRDLAGRWDDICERAPIDASALRREDLARDALVGTAAECAARIKEFYREPMAVFWVYGFPLLMALALGLAFRASPSEEITIDIVGSGDVDWEQTCTPYDDATGGMHGKLAAALRLQRLGIETWIVNGRRPGRFRRALGARPGWPGTRFPAPKAGGQSAY